MMAARVVTCSSITVPFQAAGKEWEESGSSSSRRNGSSNCSWRSSRFSNTGGSSSSSSSSSSSKLSCALVVASRRSLSGIRSTSSRRGEQQPMRWQALADGAGELGADGSSTESEGEGEGEGEGGGEKKRTLTVLLEVEGVMVDLHRHGHMEAFNKAFNSLKLSTPRWTPSLYNDLYRRANGDEKLMLAIFFDRAGWPSTLPMAEKTQFITSLLKAKGSELPAIVSSGLPLRPDFLPFLDAVRVNGGQLAALTATARCGEEMANTILKTAGGGKLSWLLPIGQEQVRGSAYGRLVVGPGAPFQEEDVFSSKLNEAVAAEKHRIAEAVSRALKVTVELDTSSASPESYRGVAALKAAAEILGSSVDDCVVIASSQPMVQLAARANIPAIVVRSSLTAQAEFPLALATYEGYGAGGALTYYRLLQKLKRA